MKIEEIIWLDKIIDKLAVKHRVATNEVEGNLMNQLLEIAQEQQVSVEMLVDSWLKEKIIKAS